ncbi:unnamed protein product, partial [Discosporangium mesarthrocarpum]
FTLLGARCSTPIEGLLLGQEISEEMRRTGRPDRRGSGPRLTFRGVPFSPDDVDSRPPEVDGPTEGSPQELAGSHKRGDMSVMGEDDIQKFGVFLTPLGGPRSIHPDSPWSPESVYRKAIDDYHMKTSENTPVSPA